MDTLKSNFSKKESQLLYYEVPVEFVDVPVELQNNNSNKWRQLNFTVKENVSLFRAQPFNFLDNYENIGNILWSIKKEQETIRVIMEDCKHTSIVANNESELIKELKVLHPSDFYIVYISSDNVTKIVVIQTGEQMNFYHDVIEHDKIKSVIAQYGTETEYYTYELDL